MREHYYCIECEKEVEPIKTRDDVGYPILVCPSGNISHELEERSTCQKCGNSAPYLEKYCGACKDRFKQEIREAISRWVVTNGYDRTELNRWLAEIAEE
jgi:hypothetical protein